MSQGEETSAPTPQESLERMKEWRLTLRATLAAFEAVISMKETELEHGQT